jgi:uncharacterized protein YqgC (DUF456 family)
MGNVGVFCICLDYFKAIWFILGPFGFILGPLANFVVVWYIFSQEKSGNSARRGKLSRTLYFSLKLALASKILASALGQCYDHKFG